MGGCASKPKEFLARVTQSSSAPIAADPPIADQVKSDSNEAVLLDFSEQKKEDEDGAEKSVELEAANVEVVSKEVAQEVAKPQENEEAVKADETKPDEEMKPKEETKPAADSNDVVVAEQALAPAPTSSEDKVVSN